MHGDWFPLIEFHLYASQLTAEQLWEAHGMKETNGEKLFMATKEMESSIMVLGLST